ncbi:hypothetical protein GCM10009422_20520 [Brevundimonas kwangchunensis]|uniref:Uncharacterized protein n=1 Tax=Brevundimonas kwangchunensis TaxID=322163 RepID=A0ABP3S2V2_9CAUL
MKLLLILDTAASVLLIPLALFWGLMSGMSTTTTSNAAFANAYVLINLTLPVAMLVCLIAGWIAFAVRRERIAWIVIFLPLLWVVASVVMMANWPAT